MRLILFLIFQMAIDEAFKDQVSILDLFKVKANLKALIYTCALASFQQFTGVNVVLFYMQNIFIAAESSVPTEQAPIIIGVVQVLASAVTPLIVDRSGRRMLLVFSGIGETISLVSNFFLFLILILNKIFISSLCHEFEDTLLSCKILPRCMKLLSSHATLFLYLINNRSVQKFALKIVFKVSVFIKG